MPPALPFDFYSLVRSHPWTPLLFFFAALFAALLRTHIVLAYKQRFLMPPGPKGIPILGNLPQLLEKQPLRDKMTAWKKEYGSIFSLNVAGQAIVVLNTPEVVNDLLERRADIYSDRPANIMGGQLMTGGQFFLFTPLGQLHAKLRKAAQEGLTPKAVRSYLPMEERESSLFILNILKDPAGWQKETNRTPLSLILSILYGWKPITDMNDPLIQEIKENIDKLAYAVLPGSYLIDLFPSLIHIPYWLSKWKQEGLYYYQRNTQLVESIIDDVRKKRAEIPHCFAFSLLTRMENKELSSAEAAWIAGTLLGGGAGTTADVLQSFMLAMALNPDVMRRGQAQVDAVVGRDRMPTFADLEHLPYVSAMVKESLRWKMIAPIGVPHRCTEDNWYKGYLIPKGTIVIANIWGMHQDPVLYSNPDQYQPERFLDDSGKLKVFSAETHNQGHFIFGFGKRLCPGMHIANASLYIHIASILWAFNISNATTLDGVPLTAPEPAFVENGALVAPRAYKCTMAPRFPEVMNLVELEHAKRSGK